MLKSWGIHLEKKMKMIKFRHYRNSGSLGIKYVFGINLYDLTIQPTLDIIIGKHVFVIFWKRYD